MARKAREKSLSGRVDGDFYEEVFAYTEAAEIGIADLVRDAVREFMVNHPVQAKE